MIDELIADAIAAQNVRKVLDGTLTDPLPGTLAAAVKERLDACQTPS